MSIDYYKTGWLPVKPLNGTRTRKGLTPFKAVCKLDCGLQVFLKSQAWDYQDEILGNSVDVKFKKIASMMYAQLTLAWGNPNFDFSKTLRHLE